MKELTLKKKIKYIEYVISTLKYKYEKGQAGVCNLEKAFNYENKFPELYNLIRKGINRRHNKYPNVDIAYAWDNNRLRLAAMKRLLIKLNKQLKDES